MTQYEVDFYRQFGLLCKTMQGIKEELAKANELKAIELAHKGLIRIADTNDAQGNIVKGDKQ